MAGKAEFQLHFEALTPLPAGQAPNKGYLQVLFSECYERVMSVPSTRGGGAHGHLAILMSAAKYAELPNTIAFNEPAHPGEAPHHAADATQFQIAETNRLFNVQIEDFKIYQSVKTSIKDLIRKAVPDIYLNELAEERFGYANVTPRTMLEHLETTYGSVIEADLTKNLEDIQKQWSPEQPLEDLFKQIRICRAFAEGHDTITEKSAVRYALTNLENTGVFKEAVKEWKTKDENQKTWTNFKSHFQEANKLRLEEMTTSQAGFMAKEEQKTNSNTSKSTDTSNQTPTLPEYSYCWTHGLCKNTNHTSATCQKRAEGHNVNATLDNMMGGNNTIRRRSNETAIFKRQD